MIIYVQSRGRSQEHDYRWLEVRKSSQSPSIPPLLKDLKVEELIESQKPSIILARSGKYLLLLVTAMESREERTDFMRRQIRNSVAWVSEEKPEIEQLFRAITVRALRGELAADIDKAIGIGGEYGFEVDFEQLHHLVDRLEVSVQPATFACFKYGKNNIDLRSDLASELSQFSLPHDSGNPIILVVVTTLKSQEALARLRVWRGLSSRIESQTWIEVSNSASKGTELGSQKKNSVARNSTRGHRGRNRVDDLEQHSQLSSSEFTAKERNVEPTDFSDIIEQGASNLTESLHFALNQVVSGASQVAGLPDYHLRYLLQMLEFMLRVDELQQSAREKSLSSNQLKVLEQAKDAIAHFSQYMNEIDKHR